MIPWYFNIFLCLCSLLKSQPPPLDMPTWQFPGFKFYPNGMVYLERPGLRIFSLDQLILQMYSGQLNKWRILFGTIYCLAQLSSFIFYIVKTSQSKTWTILTYKSGDIQMNFYGK